MKKLFVLLFLLLATNFSQAQARPTRFWNLFAASTWWYKETLTDLDGDGDIGSQKIDSLKQKRQPLGYVAVRPVTRTVFDCDDNNAAIKHGAVEICNSVDDNCNGQADDGIPLNNYYTDADGDGEGSMVFILTCSTIAPPGYVKNSLDPDDTNAYITSLNVPDPNLITLSITSTVNTIYPIHGVVYSNSEKIGQFANTPALLTAVHDLRISFLGNEGGSDMRWHHRWDDFHNNGAGLNCRDDEIAFSAMSRCGTTAVLNGRCCPTLSGVPFPTWFDYLTVLDTTNSDCMFSPNIWSAAYQHDIKHWGYDSIYSEWAQQKKELGTTIIKYAVLGTEDQIYKDMFPTADNYVTTCNGVMAWIKSNLNPEFIVADIYGAGKWDNVVTAGIPDANAYRYYLQFESTLTTYDAIRDRINNYFPSMVTTHLSLYPTKKMFYLQSEFKDQNPYNGTVAHALATVEKNIEAIKLNQLYGNVIVGFTEQNLKKLFNTNYTLPPQYYGFRIVGNADNSIYCNSTLTGCVTLAYVTTTGIEAIVMNPTATAITIQQITFNGGTRQVNGIEGYYGNNLTDRTLIVSNTLTIEKYSFKLIKLK